jgi:hypothetical protein
MWIISGGLFLFGLTVVVRGRLRMSARKRIVGTRAKLLGAAFMAIPVLCFVLSFLAMVVLKLANVRDDTAVTSANILSYLALSISVIAIAASLARLATPVSTGGSKIDFSGLESHNGSQSDFSFLPQGANVPKHADEESPRT